MESVTLHDRIAGSLYGLLVGDALGCPVEGWDRAKIVATWGELETMEETAGARWRPRGLHSDDGQQAMALCDAIAMDPDDPAPHLAQSLVALARGGSPPNDGPGCHRGTGRNFRAVIKGLRRGGDAWSGAQASAGNGVAMMIAPAGWWWRDNDDALARAVESVGRVKTTDVRGLAAGAAVAWIIAHTLATPEAPTDAGALLAFVQRVEAHCASAVPSPPYASAFSEALRAMLDSPQEARDEVLDGIARRANQTSERPCDAVAGYALASVITSIHLAGTSRAFDEAVIAAVNLGGDADTVGAMVGAMAGARFGIRAIPEIWLQPLVARGAFDDRVEAMVQRRGGVLPVQSLEAMERKWSAMARPPRGSTS